MIRPATASDLNRITATDPFFTRILSLYESYGEGLDFVAFWVQETDGGIVSAISRFEDKFSLWLTSGSELEEMTAFIHFQGAGSCLYNAAFALDFSDSPSGISGQVLEYSGGDHISDIEIYEPDLNALYTLLKACESPIFIVPEYLPFLSDLTHRRSRGKHSRGVPKGARHARRRRHRAQPGAGQTGGGKRSQIHRQPRL